MRQLISIVLLLVTSLVASWPADAQTIPTLVVSLGGAPQTYSAAELLDRHDIQTIEVDDVAYKQVMTYQAVPLLALADRLDTADFDTVEARATDGFVAQVPVSLLTSEEATPWIAVENPANPWPKLAGRDHSAGPFYLVWQKTEDSNVGSEQWIYALAEVRDAVSPEKRWPQMAVDSTLSEDAPERLGLQIYTKNCLPCHRLDGAGEGTMGPDLAKPMPATAYLTRSGLRMLVRDPASVRSWPEMQMNGFDSDAISDGELTALIVYLEYIAGK